LGKLKSGPKIWGHFKVIHRFLGIFGRFWLFLAKKWPIFKKTAQNLLYFIFDLSELDLV